LLQGGGKKGPAEGTPKLDSRNGVPLPVEFVSNIGANGRGCMYKEVLFVRLRHCVIFLGGADITPIFGIHFDGAGGRVLGRSSNRRIAEMSGERLSSDVSESHGNVICKGAACSYSVVLGSAGPPRSYSVPARSKVILLSSRSGQVERAPPRPRDPWRGVCGPVAHRRPHFLSITAHML
jgi:hypothetical protein